MGFCAHKKVERNLLLHDNNVDGIHQHQDQGLPPANRRNTKCIRAGPGAELLLCTEIHGLCSRLGFWHLALSMPNLTPGSSTLSFLIDGFEWGTVKCNWVSSQFQLKTKQNENEPLQNSAFQKSSEIKCKSPSKSVRKHTTQAT